MLEQISTVSIWVDDQEASKAFYTYKLGLEVREDVTVPEMGNFRWLTVGPKDQPELSVALMTVPGAPVFDDELAGQVKAVVARGAAGGLFFAVRDCQATYEELRGRGVEFSQPPTQQPYGIDASFNDPSGNAIRMVQRTDGR